MHSPKVWSNLWHFLAFGLGSGLAKKSPRYLGDFGWFSLCTFAAHAAVMVGLTMDCRGQRIWRVVVRTCGC